MVGYALYTSSQKKSGGGGGSSSGTATTGGGGSSDAASIVKDLAGLGSSIAGAFSKSKDSSGSIAGGGGLPADVVNQGRADIQPDVTAIESSSTTSDYSDSSAWG